jgi:hypothetical protein
MPLEKEAISVPVARGLDTDTDPKQSKGNPLLKDVFVERAGEVEKRPLWRAHATDDIGDGRNIRAGSAVDDSGSEFRSGRSIFNKNGEPLVLAEDVLTAAGKDTIRGWGAFQRQSNTDGTAARWSSLGEFRQTEVTAHLTTPISDKLHPGGVLGPQSVRVGDHIFFLYQIKNSPSRTLAYYMIVDALTEEILEMSEVTGTDDNVTNWVISTLDMIHDAAGNETAAFAVGEDDNDIRFYTWNAVDGFNDVLVTSTDLHLTPTAATFTGRAVQELSDAVPQVNRFQYAIVYENAVSGDIDVLVYDGDRVLQGSGSRSAVNPRSIGIIPVKGRGTYRSYIGIIWKEASDTTFIVRFFDTKIGATLTSVGGSTNSITNPVAPDAADPGWMTGAGERGDSDIEIARVGGSPTDTYIRVAITWRSSVDGENFIRVYNLDDNGALTDITLGLGAEEDLGQARIISQMNAVDRRLFMLFAREDVSNTLNPGGVLMELRNTNLPNVKDVLYTPQVQILPHISTMSRDATPHSGQFGLVALENVAAADTSLFFGTSVPILLRAPFIGDDEVNVQETVDILAGVQVVIGGDTMLPAQAALSAGQLIIAQGAVVQIDRFQTEVGFWGDPDIRNLTNAAGGSLTSGAVYGYSALFEWIDGSGNIHRSRPSPSEILSPNPSAGNLSAQLDLKNLSAVTEWGTRGVGSFGDGKSRDARVFIYRTEGDGPTHRFLADASDVPIFDGVNRHEEFTQKTDGIADTDIANNEILYTESGELENRAPPASNIIVAAKNRIFIVSSEDPTVIWFSKERIDGVGLSFAAELTINISEGGPITGLAELNGELVVFKERAIYVVAGDGPDARGVGSFSLPRRIHNSVGCVHRNSVVGFQGGVFFKSKRGFYTINQSWGLSYVGLPVTTSDANGVRRAIDVPEQSRIYVLQTTAYDDDILVWDYLRGNVWSTVSPLSNPSDGPSDLTNIDGVVYAVSTKGAVHSLDGPPNASPSTIARGQFSTPWINLGGINGYQRIYWAYLIGEWDANSFLQVEVRYDYEDNPATPEIHTFTAAQLGASLADHRVRVEPHRGKVSAIKLVVSEVEHTAHSMRFSNVELMVGLQRGKLKPLKGSATI